METITKDETKELLTLRGQAVKAHKIIMSDHNNSVMGDTLVNLYNHAIDYINDYCPASLDEVIEDGYNEAGFSDVDDMTDLAKEGVADLDPNDWRFDAQITMLAGCKNARDHDYYYVNFTNGNSSGDGEVEPLNNDVAIDWIEDLTAGIDNYLKNSGQDN